MPLGWWTVAGAQPGGRRPTRSSWSRRRRPEQRQRHAAQVGERHRAPPPAGTSAGGATPRAGAAPGRSARPGSVGRRTVATSSDGRPAPAAARRWGSGRGRRRGTCAHVADHGRQRGRAVSGRTPDPQAPRRPARHTSAARAAKPSTRGGTFLRRVHQAPLAGVSPAGGTSGRTGAPARTPGAGCAGTAPAGPCATAGRAPPVGSVYHDGEVCVPNQVDGKAITVRLSGVRSIVMLDTTGPACGVGRCARRPPPPSVVALTLVAGCGGGDCPAGPCRRGRGRGGGAAAPPRRRPSPPAPPARWPGGATSCAPPAARPWPRPAGWWRCTAGASAAEMRAMTGLERPAADAPGRRLPGRDRRRLGRRQLHHRPAPAATRTSRSSTPWSTSWAPPWPGRPGRVLQRASMALRYAAQRPDRVRAVVAVAGQLPATPLSGPRAGSRCWRCTAARIPSGPTAAASPSRPPGTGPAHPHAAHARHRRRPFAGAATHAGPEPSDPDARDGTTVLTERWRDGEGTVAVLLLTVVGGGTRGRPRRSRPRRTSGPRPGTSTPAPRPSASWWTATPARSRGRRGRLRCPAWSPNPRPAGGRSPPAHGRRRRRRPRGRGRRPGAGDAAVRLPGRGVPHAHRAGRHLGWWSPNPRAVLPLDGLRVSRSLRRSLRDSRSGSTPPSTGWRRARPPAPHGWITPASGRPTGACTSSAGPTRWRRGPSTTAVRHAGRRPLRRGGGRAVRRGVDVPPPPDASKAALVALVEHLVAAGAEGRLLDVQWQTPHLATLGVVEIPPAGVPAAPGGGPRTPATARVRIVTGPAGLRRSGGREGERRGGTGARATRACPSRTVPG